MGISEKLLRLRLKRVRVHYQSIIDHPRQCHIILFTNIAALVIQRPIASKHHILISAAAGPGW